MIDNAQRLTRTDPMAGSVAQGPHDAVPQPPASERPQGAPPNRARTLVDASVVPPGMALLAAERPAGPRVRPEVQRTLDAAFRFLTESRGENKREEKLVALVETVAALLTGEPVAQTRLREFNHLSRGDEAKFLSRLGLGDDRAAAFASLNPSERAALTGMYGNAAGKLGSEVMPGWFKIAITFGGAASRTAALGSVSYWSNISAITGRTAETYEALEPGKTAQAREDLAATEELLRKYNIRRPPPMALPASQIPSELLMTGTASALVPEVMFAGERKYGGRANGPLMRAGALDALKRVYATGDLTFIVRRAEAEMRGNSEHAWATRTIILAVRAGPLLKANRDEWESYSPESRAVIEDLVARAQRVAPGLRAISPERYDHAESAVRSGLKRLEEKAGEFQQNAKD